MPTHKRAARAGVALNLDNDTFDSISGVFIDRFVSFLEFLHHEHSELVTLYLKVD